MATVAVVDGGRCGAGGGGRMVVCHSLCFSISISSLLFPIPSVPANLLLTPFRFTVVPPPMCGHSVVVSGPVSKVTFAPPPRCNDFLALLADGSVAMFGYAAQPRTEKDENGFKNVTCPPTLVATAK